jgi:hypothetical protein
MRCPTLRRDWCCLALSLFSGSEGKQRDSAGQCERTEDWRYGNVVLFFGGGVNRPDIKNLFLERVGESLVGQRQPAHND